MLLKLIPLPSQPTIHFSLSLPTFPPHLEPPQSYTAQINHLLVEDLEVPNTLHSLDKSVGLMSLLEEVIFEIKDGTGDRGNGGAGGDWCAAQKAVLVTCRFVDGAIEEWVLGDSSTEGIGLISALECIIHNVQESTQEDDKERQRYLQSEQSRALNNRLSMPPVPSPLLSMAGKPRHKKQRSLFMQLVSSIVNLTSPSSSSSSSSHLPTFVDPSHPEVFYSPPPSPTSDTPTVPPPSSNRARLLRRIARSNLVNTYRRHVIPELTRRFPKEGGFGVWILYSMRRRALERMEDLIEEAARLQQQQEHQYQQALGLRQRHEYQEREQEQYRSQQGRARDLIRVDEHPFAFRPSMEDGGFSATTMTVPLSFSDEGGSVETENELVNVSTNGNGKCEEIEDDLETVTDGSSIHTPSSTSHLGSGFMGGSYSNFPPDSLDSPTSASSTSMTTHPSAIPPKSPPSNLQPPLPPHFHFEYTQLSRLRQRLHSLILFADSQIRIAEDEKRNRDEILLVRGRRRAWLNRELGVGQGAWGVSGGDSGTGKGLGQMQWGFAAPFKSSPLARYSWSASAKLDDSTASTTHTNDRGACLPDVQQQQVDEDDEDDFAYDELHGPPVVRNHSLSYTHGRQSRRSRYRNGGGSCKKLLPVAEEFEYEYDQNSALDVNSDGVGVIDIRLYKPPGLHDLDDSFSHRDDPFLHHHPQEDGDTDSLSDGFSLEDPRELDLELGFGLHDPNSFIGEEDGDALLALGGDDVDAYRHSERGRVQEHGRREHRRSSESIRVAFEMERPTIIPRVRDGLVGQEDHLVSSSGSPTRTSSSTSTRSGGLLNWGYWSVGKSGGNNDNGERTVRRCRSWKSGIGIGLGTRGRSLNKTCQRRGSDEEEEQDTRLRRRASMSSTSSTTSTSSTKSQQHQREPAQVEPEAEFHRDQGQDQHQSSTIPLLCQSVSFSVSHTPATASVTAPPLPTPANTDSTTIPTTSTSTTLTALRPNVTTTSAKDPADPAIATSAVNNTITFVPTPVSITAKKLCMTSPAPNVYADLDVSVVRVGDDDKILSLGLGTNQSITIGGASHTAQTQSAPGQSQRLRPRRHKREYQYQHQHQHAYGNDVHCGQDERDEYEFAGYGQFGESDTHLYPKHHHQHRQKSMIHARRHLDELLLEEGLFGCDSMGDQEFTLAMDIPLSGSRRGSTGFGVATGRKTSRKLQYLQLHQNRDSSQQRRFQLRQLHEPVQTLPSSFSAPSPSPPDISSSDTVTQGIRESSRGPVAC